MTDQNNAAQPLLTDLELIDIGAKHGRPSVALLPMWRAVEAAVLSKLRAEGVQAGDERGTFEIEYAKELYARDTPPTFAAFMRNPDGSYALPIVARAWAMWKVRAALASAPSDPEVAEVDFLVRMLEKLETWRAEEWSELLERRPAILAMLRPMVLASAPVADAGNWQQYRLRGSNENAEQVIERERRAYADLLQSVMDKRRDQASAPVAGEAVARRHALLEAIHRYGNARAMAEHNIAYRDEVRNTADALVALFDAAPQASEAVREKDIMRFNIHGTIINPHPNGMYVRYEDHRAALSAQPGAQRTGGSE